MGSFVKWVEGARFFARPRAVPADCTLPQDGDWDSTFSSCRFSAADTCLPPYLDATLTGDGCVCATFSDYVAKFSECVLDTPYSACIDDENEQIMASWSSGHCDAITTPDTTTDPSTSTPEPSSTTTPPPPTTTPDPPSSSDTPDSPSSTEEPAPSTQPPEPTDPPSTFSPLPSSAPSSAPEPSSLFTPAPSSEEPSSQEKTSKQPTSETPEVTPSSVPKPSLVPVTIAPRVSAQTTGSVSSSSSTHAPVAKWTGSGNLLQGYCATPEYTILDGPTAYWAPIVGCIGDRPDCCPFDVPLTTQGPTTATADPQTITIVIPASGSITSSVGNNGGFPNALSPAQATLDRCPDDYHSVGNGCCPSNYFPWSTDFGGHTPCYSTLPIATTPPPIPDSLVNTITTASAKPTSAIINVVYAMQYPVKPVSKPALTQNAKIGIGAGAGGAALVFGILLFLLLWKHKAHKRDKAALESLSGFGPGLSSTRQSVAASSAVGGVKEWRQNVPTSPAAQSRFHEGLEPTLPNVAAAQYPADWRPGQHQRQRQSSMSPPIPAPYARNSIPSPPIPEGYSEADSQHGILNNRYSNNNTPGVASDGGYSSRSELQSGEYPFPRQELQGVPEEGGQQWPVYQNAPVGQQMYQAPQMSQMQPMQPMQPWSGVQGEQQRYYEAPAGRMTPKVG